MLVVYQMVLTGTQIEVSDSSHLFSTCESSSGELCSGVGSLLQERHVGVSPAAGHALQVVKEMETMTRGEGLKGMGLFSQRRGQSFFLQPSDRCLQRRQNQTLRGGPQWKVLKTKVRARKIWLDIRKFSLFSLQGWSDRKLIF